MQSIFATMRFRPQFQVLAACAAFVSLGCDDGGEAPTEAAALAVDDGPRTNVGPWCDRCSYRAICPASQQQRWEPVDYDDDDD